MATSTNHHIEETPYRTPTPTLSILQDWDTVKSADEKEFSYVAFSSNSIECLKRMLATEDIVTFDNDGIGYNSK